MPSSRKRPCAIVIVVFATITEGTLASSGTRPRRSQAFTASPPSAAVGVARLKASPARRTPRRVRKATPSRRNANCHPSVSNTMTSATGKQSTIASRHESWTIEARIAAGSFVATRTANRTTPTTSRTSRRWRRSALPVEEQQDADRGERAGPEPSGHPRLGRGQPELEPAAPADEHPEEAERRVRHLHQELFLEVQAGVRMREKEAAADGAEERKDERRAPGAQATRADHPLEEREGDDQQDEHAVLQHLGVGHALPKPQGPERPRAGVVADQQEAGEPEEDQRPVARPARPAGREQDREEPHREDEQPRDVVVELGPRAVLGGPRGVAIGDRHLRDRRRRERWPPGREPRADLGERRAVRGHVDRRRQRGQRRRDEEGRHAEPDLDLTNRRRRAGPTSDAAGSRRTARKFIPPRVRSPARIPTLVRTIMPYDVPSSAWAPPTYESVSASPATTRTATAVSASAEKRLSRSAGHACAPRPSAVRTRWPRPPIHAAAAAWCSPSTVSRRPRGPSRAAAWLVHAALIASASAPPRSATHPSPVPATRRTRRQPTTSPTQATTRAAAARTYVEATSSRTGQPPPPTRAPSWTASARSCAPPRTAAPAAETARLRPSGDASAGRARTAGRSTSSANRTPPMAMAWPHSATPRSRTSTKPATAPQARRRAAPTHRRSSRKIGVPTEARIRNTSARPKADRTTTR